MPRLKSYEAAGFRYLQVRIGARELLLDDALLREHASALRECVGLTGLGLIVHGPDEVMAGAAEHDALLGAALGYAALAGAQIVIYHGLCVRTGDPRAEARLAQEERSLRSLAVLARELGVRIAIENLAPPYPGPELVCHQPAAIVALVRRLDSVDVGLCLDVGHAHIAAGYAGCELLELIAPALDRVLLFHVHDNFGARPGAARAGGIEPVRLDLHLAPGAGSVPWAALAPVLAAHPAPLMLEIHPFKRPPPATLAVVMGELLGPGRSVKAV